MTQLYDLTTEIGEYWFGYLTFKAYLVPNRYRLSLTISNKDRRHLHKLIKDLNKIAIPKQSQTKYYYYINNKKLMGDYRAGPWLNLGIFTTLIFSLSAAYMGIVGLIDSFSRLLG